MALPRRIIFFRFQLVFTTCGAAEVTLTVMSISCCGSPVNDAGLPWIVSTVTASACEDAKQKSKCVDLTVLLLTSTELGAVTLT